MVRDEGRLSRVRGLLLVLIGAMDIRTGAAMDDDGRTTSTAAGTALPLALVSGAGSKLDNGSAVAW